MNSIQSDRSEHKIKAAADRGRPFHVNITHRKTVRNIPGRDFGRYKQRQWRITAAVRSSSFERERRRWRRSVTE